MFLCTYEWVLYSLKDKRQTTPIASQGQKHVPLSLSRAHNLCKSGLEYHWPKIIHFFGSALSCYELSQTRGVQFVSAASDASTLLFITQYCSFCLHSCGLQKVQINFIVLWDSSGIFTTLTCWSLVRLERCTKHHTLQLLTKVQSMITW